MALGAYGFALSGLRLLAAAAAAALLSLTTIIPAGAQDVALAEIAPVDLTAGVLDQLQAQRDIIEASKPRLTAEMLQSYVNRQQQLKSFNGFYDGSEALSGDMLSSYIAAKQNSALDAIERIEPNLTPDMVADYVKRDDFMTTPRRVRFAKDEQLCLTQAIYHEARGESFEGQEAVANIIVNRAMSKGYPNTVCGVVFQNADKGRYRCQFTFACDGRSDMGTERAAWTRAAQLAETTYQQFRQGKRPDVLPGSALFYHTTEVSPSWSRSFRRVAAIGSHIFYSKS